MNKRGTSKSGAPGKARELYVSGQSDSISAAATAAGLDPTRLWARARAEDWAGARAEHRRRIEATTREESSRREGQALGQLRAQALAGALESVVSFRRRLKDGEVEAGPREAEALARLARLAHELGTAIPSDGEGPAIEAVLRDLEGRLG